jgi:hypothetical protein
LDRIVVNFANVGFYYGNRFVKDKADEDNNIFHWEGVRRCVRHLTEEEGWIVVGVIPEDFKALDVDPGGGNAKVDKVPNDIRKMCEHVEEIPKDKSRMNANHKSLDDEATIRLAYRRNCLLLDNDNYRDWFRNLRDEKIRQWLNDSHERVHMKYYFDTGLGIFELLGGSADRGASDEEKEREKRKRRRAAAQPDIIEVLPVRSKSIGSSSKSRKVSVSKGGSLVTKVAANLPATKLRRLQPAARPPVVALHPREAGNVHQQNVSLLQESHHASLPSFANVHDVNEAGLTPLCQAAHDGHIGHIRSLLKQGADPNVSDRHGVHPLFYAVDNEDLQAIQLLKRHGASVSQARGRDNETLPEYVQRRLKKEGPGAFARKVLNELRHAIPSGGQMTLSASRGGDVVVLEANDPDSASLHDQQDRTVIPTTAVSSSKRPLGNSSLKSKEFKQKNAGNANDQSQCIDLDTDEDWTAEECATKLAAAFAHSMESDADNVDDSGGSSVPAVPVPGNLVLVAADDPYL